MPHFRTKTTVVSKSKQNIQLEKYGAEVALGQRMFIDYQIRNGRLLNSNKPEVKSVGEFLKTILKTLKIQQKQFAEYLD